MFVVVGFGETLSSCLAFTQCTLFRSTPGSPLVCMMGFICGYGFRMRLHFQQVNGIPEKVVLVGATFLRFTPPCFPTFLVSQGSNTPFPDGIFLSFLTSGSVLIITAGGLVLSMSSVLGNRSCLRCSISTKHVLYYFLPL